MPTAVLPCFNRHLVPATLLAFSCVLASPAVAAEPTAAYGNPLFTYAHCVMRETRRLGQAEQKPPVTSPDYPGFEARVLHRVFEACAPQIDQTAVMSRLKGEEARQGYYAAIGDYTRFLVGMQLAGD